MRAKEFVFEVRAGKVPKDYQHSSVGLHTFSDAEHANSDYTHYRLGLALAMSDGKSPLVDMDPKTFYGKKHTAQPYTQEEADMLKQAYELVGANHKDLNGGDLNSKELPEVNSVSPVITPKKNRYGV
jgi:hypothetical protein